MDKKKKNSRNQKPDTFSTVAGMLTKSERESLRQEMMEAHLYFQAELRRNPVKKL